MENINSLLENANNGDAVSQYKLGRAYETGDGVEKNMETAIMWYRKSAENGYKNAEVKLKLLPVQDISSKEESSQEEPAQKYQAPEVPKLGTINNQTMGDTYVQKSPKSKTIAIILALFLGVYGAHDFYLGYTKNGIIKIVLTLSVIGIFVSGPWTIIDLIKIICNGKLDSNGHLLK